MAELRALAAKTAGHPVPIGANAGLLWGPHLADYQSVDLFSAEIPHQAEARRFSDDPLVAYRLADAVRRPLASTASGGDWALIKEENRPGLVQGWIALGYAAGHRLMAPHHQWCYTPQKGTHWYDGPTEKYAPLYQFVRHHADLFDGYQNHADLVVAFSQHTLDRERSRVIGLCDRLAAANISYAIAFGGSEVVDHPLPREDLRQAAHLLVLEPKDFSAGDQKTLAACKTVSRCGNLAQALTNVTPAVRVEASGTLRVLPRVRAGQAVIHLVNWNYDAAKDSVTPLKKVRLTLNPSALGIAGASEARLFSPGHEPITLPIQNGVVVLPKLSLWAVLAISRERNLATP